MQYKGKLMVYDYEVKTCVLGRSSMNFVSSSLRLIVTTYSPLHFFTFLTHFRAQNSTLLTL